MSSKVVTLPAAAVGPEAAAFARAARRGGADFVEIRTDLHGLADIDVGALASEVALLVAERGGRPIPTSWEVAAALVDTPQQARRAVGGAHLVSHHAELPMLPRDADAFWSEVAAGAGSIKHVEPTGGLSEAHRLLETQRLLQARFGPHRVTVLATGECALPFRALLAHRNALDYTALAPGAGSAPGQRLLADAIAADSAGGRSRLGIIGSGIAGSRSPRAHPQPFDRIDVPPWAPVNDLVGCLLPYYRGLAITSPFKRRVATHLGVEGGAVNTLVRHASGWIAANTDVHGADAALQALGATRITVLGRGGAAVALQAAAAARRLRCEVVRREEIAGVRLGTTCLWTWPPGVAAPSGMRLSGATVGVIAYGRAAREIGAQILALGGRPAFLGARWFVAQARAQRSLWMGAA